MPNMMLSVREQPTAPNVTDSSTRLMGVISSPLKPSRSMPGASRNDDGIPISSKVDENMMSAELLPSMKTRRTSMSLMVTVITSASWQGRVIPLASLGPKVAGAVV